MPRDTFSGSVSSGLLAYAKAGNQQATTTLYGTAPTQSDYLFLPEVLLPDDAFIEVGVSTLFFTSASLRIDMGIFMDNVEIERDYSTFTASAQHRRSYFTGILIGDGARHTFDFRFGPASAGTVTQNAVSAGNLSSYMWAKVL